MNTDLDSVPTAFNEFAESSWVLFMPLQELVQYVNEDSLFGSLLFQIRGQSKVRQFLSNLLKFGDVALG